MAPDRVRAREMLLWRRACLARVRVSELLCWCRAGLGRVRDSELSRWRRACLDRVRDLELLQWFRAWGHVFFKRDSADVVFMLGWWVWWGIIIAPSSPVWER